MIQGEVLCFTNGGDAAEGGNGDLSNLYNNGVLLESSYDGVVVAGGSSSEENLSIRSLLYSISMLKEKVGDVESFVSIYLNQQENHYYDHSHQTTVDQQLTSSMAFSSMANLIQEIVHTASFMMLSCEQMALSGTTTTTTTQIGNINNELHTMQKANNQEVFNNGDSFYHHHASKNTNQESPSSLSVEAAYDLVEVDAADLLARYTHYCQVCGRGFKREANLRMHMRAHGDKYNKLSLMSNNNINNNNNSLKQNKNDNEVEHNNNTRTKAVAVAVAPPRKYSCPQKGCRWNKNHVKFQPLKSMVCVRNHYKRSHCPKMFVCKRCNMKEFSVLSDLKTHEKHCGDNVKKLYCSCGTSFTNNHKLMDHVALFLGHTPLIYP
ncbi:hypothetical protein SOVF_134450 [Spinacia oleracea]|nr:hypothetical protein SOVF_134450 [Spinacia oleracea]